MRTTKAVAALAGIGLTLGLTSVAWASPGQTSSTIYDGVTAEELAQALVGTGVSVSNVSYTGAEWAAGYVTGMGAATGIEEGVALSTGSVAEVTESDFYDHGSLLGPNDHPDYWIDNELPGDPQLDEFSGKTTQDAAYLEFDFVPAGSTIELRYLFGAEDYNEFSDEPDYADAFAVFVNGVNCATIGGGAINVTTVNSTTNAESFVDNTEGTLDTETDGFTVVLTCTAPVNAGQTNHLKISIGDVTDGEFDSTVFLEAGSFTSHAPPQAANDSFYTASGKALKVAAPGVLGNDSDVNADAMTAVLVQGPANGTLTLNADGSFTYTPKAGFTGKDSFTYMAVDKDGNSNVATVTISVTGQAKATGGAGDTKTGQAVTNPKADGPANPKADSPAKAEGKTDGKQVPASADGKLADTGTNSTPLLGIGLALLLSGALILGIRRYAPKR